MPRALREPKLQYAVLQTGLPDKCMGWLERMQQAMRWWHQDQESFCDQGQGLSWQRLRCSVSERKLQHTGMPSAANHIDKGHLFCDHQHPISWRRAFGHRWQHRYILVDDGLLHHRGPNYHGNTAKLLCLAWRNFMVYRPPGVSWASQRRLVGRLYYQRTSGAGHTSAL